MSDKENQGLTPEQEFEKIFNEISGGMDEGVGNVPEQEVVIPPTESTPVEEQKEEHGNDGSLAGTAEVVTPQTETPPVEAKPPETDYKDLYDKEVQKTRSWDGRIRAANDRASKAEAELYKLTIEIAELREKGTAPSEPIETSMVDDPDIKQFFDDYPELVKPFEKLVVSKGSEIARKVVEERLKDFSPKIEKLEKKVANNDVDTHFIVIEKVHPDWKSLVDNGDVDRWIEAQPLFIQQDATRVVERGSTDEVIQLLDAVKKSKTVVAPPKIPSPPKKNPEDLLAVPASRSEIPKQEQEKDFDYWWKVINKEK